MDGGGRLRALTPGRVGLAVGGGVGCGGVGARAPRDEQISQRVSYFCRF